MFHVFASVIQGFKIRVHLVSLLFNALLFSYSYALSVTVLTLWVAPSKMFYNISIGFNKAKTNCGIAQVLGILLWNSCNFFEQQKFAICPL